MITFRTSTEITTDRRILLDLPPETPIGKAELVVTVSPQQPAASPNGNLRSHFGTIRGGDRRAADNRRIDADLAREYGDTHD